MIIRNVKLTDAKAICDIYNYYVTNTIITFEQEPFSESDIAKKITEITEKGFPYIVYEENQKVIGYAYLNNWRTRRAYDITLETSIYLNKENMGRGIGEIVEFISINDL